MTDSFPRIAFHVTYPSCFLAAHPSHLIHSPSSTKYWRRWRLFVPLLLLVSTRAVYIMTSASCTPIVACHRRPVLTRSHALSTSHLRSAARVCCIRQDATSCLLRLACCKLHKIRSAGQRRDSPRLQITFATPSAAESAVKRRNSVASTILQALAAAVILVQPASALAGEVIQGIPRVADGDTLQVTVAPSSRLPPQRLLFEQSSQFYR